MIILKILLWIILAVFGIVLLFLVLSLNADLIYIDNKFIYKVRYGFFTVYSSDNKNFLSKFIKNKKKAETADFSDDTETYEDIPISEDYEEEDVSETEDTQPEDNIGKNSETSDNTEEIHKNPKKAPENKRKTKKPEKTQNSEKEKISDGKVEFLFDLIRSADRPFLKLCRGIKFSNVYIDFVVADEDAYECALNYGKISGMVYNILGWFSVVFSVKFRTVDVVPDFKGNESRWDMSAKVSFRPITLVIAGIYFLITYIFRFMIPEKRQREELKKN